MYLIQFIVKMIEFAWMGNHVLQFRVPWVQENIIQHEQGQAGGDRWILFDVCEGRDMYHHVRFECKLYNTKYRDTGKPVCGNAEFLVKLDQERKK